MLFLLMRGVVSLLSSLSYPSSFPLVLFFTTHSQNASAFFPFFFLFLTQFFRLVCAWHRRRPGELFDSVAIEKRATGPGFSVVSSKL